MIVCDTRPIVALSNHRDAHHFTANNLIPRLARGGGDAAVASDGPS